MRLSRLALACAAVAFPLLAKAQSTAFPPALEARAIALMQQCQAAGGQVTNGDRGFVINNFDLTGDGRPDFVMDEAGFACTNRQVTSVTPTGAPLEVFDGATGQSAIRTLAFTWTIQPVQGRNTMIVTLRGSLCGAGAQAATACQRPLAFNAQTRKLVGAPSMAQAPQGGRSTDPLASGPAPKTGAAVATAPPAPAPAGPAPKVGALTLTEADKAAAFRAANFKLVGRQWKGCVEDPRDYYTGGEISEVTDLNNDGRPEVVISENSTFCHGQQGDWFTVLSKDANGSWRQVLEIDGVYSPLTSRANGWLEIEIGGPGTRGFPIWRYNGKEYAYNRGPRPGF